MENKPELIYLKKTVSWRFWAFGFHTYVYQFKYDILCIGIGPLRLHFIKN